MGQETPTPPTSRPVSPAYPTSSAEQRRLARRTAATSAAFFLPHLRPGMRLLDCGCGVGTITIGLAGAVSPGEVTGVDFEPGQIDAARALAADRAVRNVRFEAGSVYDLPYPDASFDAVFAHTLLMHLGEPRRGLREMRRVLKPGGVIGVADDDQGTLLLSPETPLFEEFYRLHQRWLREVRGAHPFAARHHRRTLLDAGFINVVAGASLSSFGVYGTQAETRDVAAWWAHFARSPWFRDIARSRGWADAERLEAMASAITAWGERPDAFMAVTSVTAMGWVGI